MTKEEQVIETIRKGPGMSPNEYQKLALRTASEKAMENPLLNGLLGLCGETGECRVHHKLPVDPPVNFRINKKIGHEKGKLHGIKQQHQHIFRIQI